MVDSIAEKVAEGAGEPIEVDKLEELAPVERLTMSEEQKEAMERLKKSQPRLPISKVRKIARSDPEYIVTAGNAFTAAAFATELFVQSMTEEMIQLAYLSGKTATSKSIRLSYKNLSDCVARKENYSFLEDVVPQTKNLRTLVKENKVRYTTRIEGQQTLPFEEKHEEPDLDPEDEEDLEEDEEHQDPEVEEQLREIEELNRVPDLPDDDRRSESERSDQEDDNGGVEG